MEKRPKVPPEPHKHSPRQSGVRARARRESLTISSAAKAYLQSEPQDQSLQAGASNALWALGLTRGQQLVIIAQTGYETIATAILRAAMEREIRVRTYLIGVDQSTRSTLVDRIQLHLDDADGSVLVGAQGDQELAPTFRRQVMLSATRRRHAHMVGITEAMMRQSMRADWEEVEALGSALIDRLRQASNLFVSAAGHSLHVHLDSSKRWHNASGILRQPGFTGLPGGEVLSTPASVDGFVRPEGGVWLGSRVLGRWGDLVLQFAEGKLVDATGLDSEELMARLGESEKRVGQIAFGTNLSVLAAIGAPMQDTKMPGFHMVLGYSAPELTGADFNHDAAVIPVIVRRPDMELDGEAIMAKGRYARSLLTRW